MKKILYIIDDINYKSGAQKVTLFQMKEMQKKYDVFLLSLAKPKESISFLDSEHLVSCDIWAKTELYADSFKQVMRGSAYSLSQKFFRILYAFCLRIGLGDAYFEHLIAKNLVPVMETFDAVIVVSEASKLRSLVSKLKHPRKIQWIHTDYARWSEFSEWSRSVTRNDHALYPKFDTIVVLSEYCRRGIVEKIPAIADKIAVMPNLIDGDSIIQLSKEPCPVEIQEKGLKLVTVARIDREKRIDKLLQTAQQMKQQQIAFQWYVIGDGPQRTELEEKNHELGLQEEVHFLGHMDNPYPVMAKCDALVLLSKYEGTPVTIDEAMVLGIGIIAPAIGGIPEQMKGYENCCLVENGIEDAVFQLKDASQYIYHYENENVKKIHKIEILIEGSRERGK